jgi:hypothetical protein
VVDVQRRADGARIEFVDIGSEGRDTGLRDCPCLVEAEASSGGWMTPVLGLEAGEPARCRVLALMSDRALNG